jgi:hypothetical protein
LLAVTHVLAVVNTAVMIQAVKFFISCAESFVRSRISDSVLAFKLRSFAFACA